MAEASGPNRLITIFSTIETNVNTAYLFLNKFDLTEKIKTDSLLRFTLLNSDAFPMPRRLFDLVAIGRILCIIFYNFSADSVL
jgi:hypothetical protein